MSNMPERIWAGLDRPTGFNDSDMDKLNMWSETFLASDTEYIRADVANAEIDMLRLELKQADNLHIHIVRQDAEIERLKQENAELRHELEVMIGPYSSDDHLFVSQFGARKQSARRVLDKHLKEKE